MKRKGQMMNKAVNIAAVLFGFFVIVLVINQGIKTCAREADEAVCRSSVFAREKATLEIPGPDIEKAFPFLCSTKDKELEGDKEQVEKQVADLMAKCFWQFGEGKIEDIFEEGTAIGSDHSCFICYTVTFEKDLKEEIPAEEFYKYLSETDYIIGKENESETYIDYLQNRDARILLTENINPDEVYAISMGEPTTGKCGKLCLTLSIAGAVVGGLVAIPATGGGSIAVSVAIIGASSGAGALSGYGVGLGATAIADLVEERELNTIMFTKLSDVDKKCTIAEK
jgi:hypothetical protein